MPTVQACFDRFLPDVRYMPVNGAGGQRIALLKAKLWPAGSQIKVKFAASSTPTQRRDAQAAFEEWMQWVNLDFTMAAAGPAEVRVTFDAGGGAWSYLGTDCLGIAANRATMNLGFNQGGTYLHECGHCLSGDTLIDCPRDLAKHPQGVPIKELVGQTPWVYAWKNGEIVVRKAARVWLSKRMAKTVRVRLGTGQGGRSVRQFLPPLELVGTPDHPVLLADGKTWKNLGDLEPGDRLCSLYRQKNNGRSRIRWTGGERIREHVFICEQIYGPRPDKHDCHHKDENKLNQSVENLEWKHESKHYSDHAKGKILSEEHRAKLIESNKNRVYTEEILANMSAAQMGKRDTEATRSKKSVAAKARGIPDSQREKMLAGRARFIANGGKSGMYGKKASAETRAKQSAAIKAWHEKRKQEAAANHVVLSVEPAEVQDVYDMTVPDADSFVANGVVVHNCLGAIHEHQSPFGGIKWAKENVYRDLSGPPNNWDKATIDNNMFAAYSKSQLNGSEFDPRSIMLYAIPKSWTTDGFQSKPNATLSERDKQWAAKCYPGRGTVKPEPEPILVPVVDLEPTGESLAQPGERDLFQFEVTKSGKHRIEAISRTSLVLHVFGPDSRTTLVAKTDNAGVDFNCRLEVPLTPGVYYAQVAGADATASGEYSLLILRLAPGVLFDEQAVIWKGQLMGGIYNLIQR